MKSIRYPLFAFLLMGLSLTGCQSHPQPQQGLTAEQIRLLKAEGFTPSDEGWELGLSAKLLFGSNADRITPQSRTVVERLGRVLLTSGIDRLILEGHTDSYGDPAYNQQLSIRRAQSVADVLVGLGMQEENIQVVGRGMDRPVAANTNAAGRQENRRVSVIVPAD